LGHVLFGIHFGDYYCFEATDLCEMFVVFIVEATNSVAMLLGLKEPKKFLDLQ
jgi:hypothetical protein